MAEATAPGGTRWSRSSAPAGSGADWENARRWFTTPTQDQWVARMNSDPDVFTAILSDIFRETKAERERRAGKARIGRRPKVIDGSLDELWAMITPRYAMEDFPQALTGLREGESDAAFARKVNLSRRTLDHMVSGKVRLEMWRMERIAKACEVSPAYFREYRESFVLTVVAQMLQGNPNLSVKFARAFSGKGRR